MINYTYQNCYAHQKNLKDLRQIQNDVGPGKDIKPRQNYVRAKFIESRIDAGSDAWKYKVVYNLFIKFLF